MSKVRDRLAQELARKVERHRVVVWADPYGEYRDVARDVTPEAVAFESFDGSWYDLRRRAEPQIGRTEPRLLVYVDADEPAEDPLAEVRAAGTTFTRRLDTLLRDALRDDLAAAKIDEIAGAADSLTAAEALVEGGAASGPARLVQAFRTSDTTELLLHIARGNLENQALVDEAASFASSTVGGSFSADGDELAAKLSRHLVVADLTNRVGKLPGDLAKTLGTVTAAQRRRAVAALRRWQSDRRETASYLGAMKRADKDLRVDDAVGWSDELTDADSVPGYDRLALNEFCRLHERGAFVEAETLAAARSDSYWAKEAEDAGWRSRWAVAHAVAQLRHLITHDATSPGAQSPAAFLDDYVQRQFHIDRAHRRLELALLDLEDHAALTDAIRDARATYLDWLDGVLVRFTSAVANEGLTHDGQLAQSHIHADVVAPRVTHGPVAYFMVDALRYELGHDLVDVVRRAFPDGRVEVTPAVALLPSITPVGMANLCPGAEAGLGLQLDGSSRLAVTIAGEPMAGVPPRITRLQAAHGSVADFTLDDLLRIDPAELEERITGADLLLVRSQEIDQAGEAGKITAGFQAFTETVRNIQRAVSRLANVGITQAVVTADHGFISLTRELGQSRIIDKPGGKGEVHRRAFVGKGGTAGEALLRIPLADIGIASDLDVLVPRGLALISGGGARGFFHGGCSPQELLVPVVTIEVEATKQGSSLPTVTATLTPKITSQVFTAKLSLAADLLSTAMEVRVVPVSESGDTIGVLATAGGAEREGGLVHLEPGEEATLGFRLTSTLSRNDKVELHVFDARTDRRLATSDKSATVARRLEVDDELA
jgi:hypothetical protein